MKSWIQQRVKVITHEPSRLQMESWTPKIEAWRLKMEIWRLCRPVVADSHNLDEEQDRDPH
jgi:hypothetical protein